MARPNSLRAELLACAATMLLTTLVVCARAWAAEDPPEIALDCGANAGCATRVPCSGADNTNCCCRVSPGVPGSAFSCQCVTNAYCLGSNCTNATAD